MRIGFGYDIHRLVKGRTLILGGVIIPHSMGEEGHSDGDVLIHAVIDALLGAAGLGDIGTHFPPSDDQFKDISSLILLDRTVAIIKDSRCKIHNIDCTIILETPRLTPYKGEIARTLAGALRINKNFVSVKAKTSEKIGETGAGRAVEAYAVVLLDERR